MSKSQYEATLREMQKKYGTKPKEKEQTSHQVTPLNDQYENTLLEMQQKYGTYEAVDSNYIDSFFRDVDTYQKKYGKLLSNNGYLSAQENYLSHSDEIEPLRSRALSIRNYVDANKQNYDFADYDAIMKTLDDIDNIFDQYGASFSTSRDFYSKFKTEQDYNDYHRESSLEKQYGRMSYSQIMDILDSWDDSAEFAPEVGWTNAEEKAWLESYAPTVMKSQDADAKISANSQKIAELEAQLQEYDRIRLGSVSTMGDNSRSFVQKYGNPVDIENQIEQLKTDNWNLENRKKYGYLSKNADFAEKSGYVSTKEDSWWDKLDNYGRGDYEDPTYEYINAPDSVFREELDRNYILKANNPMGERQKLNWDLYTLMEPGEIANYNYLYQTEGKEAAEEYLEYLSYDLNRRNIYGYQQRIANATDGELVAANIASVPLNLMSGMGAINIAGQNISRDIQEAITGEYAGPIDYNTRAAGMSVGVTSVRGTTAARIADATGTIQLDSKKNPVLSRILNGKSLGDAYQLGMSMADSVVAATMGPVGPALLGGSAATQGILDAAANGATDEQALAMGVLNGVFEMLFEKYSLDELLNRDTRNIIEAVLRQGVAEGSEEAFTSIANNAADILIMAEKSGYMKNVQAYMDQGMDESEAMKHALIDMGIDIGWDFAGGMFTGGIMGGTKTAIDDIGYYSRVNQYAKQTYGGDVQNLTTEALAVDPNSKLAQKVQKRSSEGKNVTGRQIRRVVEKTQAAVKAQSAENANLTIEQVAEKYGDQAEAVIRNYQQGQDVYRYAQAYDLAYQMGKNGVRESYVMNSPTLSYLTDSQRDIAYNTGKDAAAAIAAEQPSQPTTAAKQAKSTSEVAEPITETTPTQEELETDTDFSTPSSIKRVASVKNGQMILEMEDGSRVVSSEINYANDNEALVYGTIEQLGVDTVGANRLINSYKQGRVSGEVYSRGMEQAYLYGSLGLPTQEMTAKNAPAAKLTAEQRREAYRVGKRMAGQQVGTGVANVRRSIIAADKSGEKKTGGVHYDGDMSKLSERQKSSVTALGIIGKALGVDIYVYESATNEQGQHIGENGWYDPSDGSLHIDLYAGANGNSVMLFTAAHELVHFIKDWSPAKFKVLANFLMQEYGQKGVSVHELIEAQMAKAQRNGMELTYEQAFEEVIADSMEAMLADGKVMDKLAKLRAQDQSLWTKLKEAITELANKIRELYASLKPDSKEGQYVAQMKDAIEKIQALFTDALVDASANYQAANGQKNTARQGGDYSDVKLSARDEEGFKEYSAKINTIVDKAIEGKGYIDGRQKPFEIMHVGPKISAMVAQSSDGSIDISKKVIAINTGDAWHEYKRHTNVNDEVSRDQVAFTKRQFQNAIKCILSPDVVESVFTSKNNPTQNQSFAYAKRTSRGHYVVVEAVGGKNNPYIYPVMILQFTQSKWSKMMEEGKTLGEILYENDVKLRNALDIEANKKSRVFAAQFASLEAIANTPHSPQLKNNVTQADSKVKKFSTRDTEYLELAKDPEGNQEQLQQMVDEAAKAAGYTIRAYHGTSRGDRVGNVFLPERATSGPMAFFTSDRTIAENYAKAKKDTSLAYDEEYSDYYTQFRINKNGKSIKVQDLWQSLPYAEKQRLKEAGKHLTWDEDVENIIWDDDATHGLGNWDAYTLNLHKGNAIEALIDSWLESGELWGREGDFVQVLELAGINGVEYRDPDARHEKVYDTFLRIQNPFNTDAVSNEFADGFEEWYQQQPDGKYDRDTSAADMWDKNSQTAESFLERLRDDIDNGTSYAWTSIPDSMTDYLRHLGFDGIQDVGGKNGGESHIVYVPFSSEQVKDASPITYDDSGNVIPLSQRFDSSKSDIRFSTRDPELQKANQLLEKENSQLREDVNELKALLKLQRQVTNGTKFTKSSVEAAARYLKSAVNAKGDTKEFAKLLNEFYEYIASGGEITWESVSDMAQPAIQWLREHQKQERNDYAQDILKQIRGTKVYLDQQQKQEAAHAYGSYNNFRKSLMGTITLSDSANMSLDSAWHEWSQEYPYLFKEDISASDMPVAFAAAVSTLRSMTAESAYDSMFTEQELLREVYDSYWRVSTLYTAADVKQREINQLKSKHYARIEAMRKTHNEQTAKLKKEYRKAIDKVREESKTKAEKKQREIVQYYQAARDRGIESRKRTAMRHKIQKVVKKLNDLLLHETKERHVPEELKAAVAEALSAVNMDTVGAEERLAKLEAERAKAKTDKQRQEIEKRMNTVREMGGRMDERLSRLRDAYGKILEESGEFEDNFYDEVIMARITETEGIVGETALRDMNMEQLEAVYELYTMVLTSIRNLNKALSDARGAEISVLGSQVIEEVEKTGGKKKTAPKSMTKVSEFFTNNLKPVYFFEKLGSRTLSGLFDRVRDGEDTWARDMTEARDFYLEQSKKHHADSWNLEKTYSFTSSTGLDFTLTVPQIMSLYAYSKRDQARDHLLKGGIVYDPNSEIVKKKFGIKVKYTLTDATAYNISDQTLGEIIGKLSAEQITFVDEMQKYLSDTMGEKGNEVSMALYGIRMFKEQFYFPLKSAPEYMAQERQKEKGEVKIKNKGFTKKTVQNASNPIVLSDFTDVWASHVNEMSMYHAFTLPLEDFYRVRNYSKRGTETSRGRSVNETIKNAYGESATKYIEQLLKDLNGGAVTDPRETVSKAMMSKFKKAAVMASMSVVIQQPTALVRAMALIDMKYFGPAPITRGVLRTVNAKKHKALWNEVKQYAPVAIIKEMGRFDTNMGRSATDFITAREYDGFKEKTKGFFTDEGYRDEVLSWLPSVADELAWVSIWEAVKRETLHNHSNLNPKSEEFLKLSGQRFTEVIVKTQVYDSVMSRSANMRSKSTFMNMLTSFMAEPTTSINMLEDALRQGKRGNKKYAAKTIGSVYGSIVLNAALVSLVYAMRDDDEDETFLEKYLSRTTTELLDGINPLTYLPILKDVWSIAQGFDIERADMSLIADVADAVNKLSRTLDKGKDSIEGKELDKYQKELAENLWNLADTIASLAGLPVKNIRRDIKGVKNLVQTISKDENGRQTTAGSLMDEILDEIKSATPVWGQMSGKSKGDKLYDAITGGDAAYVERLKSGYKDEAAFNSAVRKALRENDPRIRQAALALLNGDTEKRVSIARSIVSEGFFDQDTVVAAINSEASALDPEESAASGGKKRGWYTKDDFAIAISKGDTALADDVRQDIINTAVANGDTREEAEKSFESSAASICKEAFLDGSIGENKTINFLVAYGGKESDSAEALVLEYSFEKETGIAYSDMKDAYMEGKLSESEAVSARVQYGKSEDEDAEATVSKWKFEKETGIVGAGEGEASAYYAYAEPNGISADTFHDYYEKKSGLHADTDQNGKAVSGSKKRKVMALIHSLPLSKAQKNALYFAEGYAESTLGEAPWH